MEEATEYEVTLGNNHYKVLRKEIDNHELNFYIDNPRVYSLFDRSETDPTQDEMEKKLCSMEDVKELKGTIESNGGLIVPIIVKGGDNIVLEGNRRLAAYRMLSKKQPEKWRYVKCDVYPEDISEDAIFILLGQYHINGQKKWAPFEEAGYVYRRIISTGCSTAHIANELGTSESTIKTRYQVYEFMVKHNDLDSSHWSYYEEYLKIQALKKARKQHPELDQKVVNDIQGHLITDAKHNIREQLGKVAKHANEGEADLLADYISGKRTLDDVARDLDDTSTDAYKTINKFRKTIMDPKFKRSIVDIPQDEIMKYKMELESIEGTVKDIITKLQNRKTLDYYQD